MNLALDRQFKNSLPMPYSEYEDVSTYMSNLDLFNLFLNSKYDFTQQFYLE